MVGEPVVMPEVVRTAVRPSSQLPEAIAVAAVYEEGTFSDVGLVMFRGDTVNSRLSNTGGAFEQMEEREWQNMTASLDSFFADAVDVTRGAERFVPYLPENMRQMLDLRGEKNRIWLRPEAIARLSHDQLRRFVSLIFDQAVLTVWSEVSGVPWSSGFNASQIRRDPPSAIASLEASTAAVRKALVDGGAVTPERMAAAQRYVRRLLGEGYMVRESPRRDGIKLPRGARMYTVMLGGPLPHVIVEGGGCVSWQSTSSERLERTRNRAARPTWIRHCGWDRRPVLRPGRRIGGISDGARVTEHRLCDVAPSPPERGASFLPLSHGYLPPRDVDRPIQCGSYRPDVRNSEHDPDANRPFCLH